MSGDVVVVDDQPGTLTLLKTLLENQGHEVRAFINGDLALRSIGFKAPDLVILDIRMPGLNGFELCEKLKADPATAEIPVIFLSAATDIDDKIAAFAAGGVDYITKPFDKAEVLARARTHISLYQAQLEVFRSKQLVETSSIATTLSNLDGSMAAANQSLCDLTGFDMNTALQMSWMQVMPEPHLLELRRAVNDLLAGRIDSYRGEHVFIHADGHPRWIDLSMTCMRKPHGQPEYIISQSVDITAQVQARKQLQESRRLLAASADSMLDPQVLLEAVRDTAGQVVDFRYLSVNRAVCTYLGLAEDELVGHTQLETTPNLEGSELQQRYIQCLKDGEPVALDDYAFFNEVLDDGRRYDIRATRAGADLLSLTWADVTERFEAAQRIANSEAQLRASVECMLNPFAILEAVRDPSGRVVDFRYLVVNRANCDYLGLTEDELIGHTQLETSPVMEKLDLHRRYIQCLADGEPVALDDYAFFVPAIEQERRYDIRANKAGDDLLSLSWTDVTKRYRDMQRLAASERNYRLVAANLTDMVVHVRDGVAVWVSPSVAGVLGGTPDYWVGRQVREVIPPEDAPDFERRAAILAVGGTVRERMRAIALDGVTHWIDVHAQPFFDDFGHQDGFTASMRLIDNQVAAEQAMEEARRQRAKADELYRRSVDHSAVGMCLADLEGNFVEANHALCEFFGFDAQTLKCMSWQQLTDPDYLKADLDNRAHILAGDIESYRMVKRYIHADGHPIWGDLSVSCIRNAEGQVEMFIAQIADITAEVETREELEEARRQQALADARYRLAMDNAAVGMCLATPEGRPQEVNEALCRFLGYDAQTLIGMDWRNLTRPEDLKEDEEKYNAMLQGRIDSYRMVKRYIRADGKPIWGDLTVSALRGEDGHVQIIYALVSDITAQVQADERNRVLAQQLQEQTDRVKSELDSAAAYISSLMPSGLDGPVTVSSRYLPSREVGGDCLDFYWIDDDHLLIKLIDVSGHGIEPALLAVSVHNLMRSGSIAREILLSPTAVLTKLNHLFAMDQHNDHYFTMWYGVYQASTRTLRYASAGAVPALVFNSGAGAAIESTALYAPSVPVGVFEDTEFAAHTYQVPSGCQMLIYSDGASEITLANGQQLTREAFQDLASRVAAASDWSLDDLVDELRALMPSGAFEDDCSLIQVRFD